MIARERRVHRSRELERRDRRLADAPLMAASASGSAAITPAKLPNRWIGVLARGLTLQRGMARQRRSSRSS